MTDVAGSSKEKVEHPVFTLALNCATREQLIETIRQLHTQLEQLKQRTAHEPPAGQRPMTLGKLILDTARGNVKQRTLTSDEAAQMRESIARYFKGPFGFREPQNDSEAAVIVGADGTSVASLYWPCHPVEETAAAEQATYALGRVMADAASTQPPGVQCGCGAWLKSLSDPHPCNQVCSHPEVVLIAGTQCMKCEKTWISTRRAAPALTKISEPKACGRRHPSIETWCKLESAHGGNHAAPVNGQVVQWSALGEISDER
jgi:hypothetical protein